MYNDQDNREYANWQIGQRRPNTPASGRAAENIVSHFPDTRNGASIVEVVRTLEVILVVENPTIH